MIPTISITHKFFHYLIFAELQLNTALLDERDKLKRSEKLAKERESEVFQLQQKLDVLKLELRKLESGRFY